MNTPIRQFLNGLMAGILIAIGGSVFLNWHEKSVAAVLFSVALLSICYKGYSLFTGKVGFMLEKHGKEEWSTLLLGLLGNACATILCGFALRYAIPNIGAAAELLCHGKLTDQNLLQTFIRALFCGVLMYLAVFSYREKNTVVGILFCVPAFIVSGFEHSIADIFYFAASGHFSLRATLFIFVVLLGNSAGALLLPALGRVGAARTDECP